MANRSWVVGDWYKPTFSDIIQLEDEVYLGDRLEFYRRMYAHWGKYVGEYEWEEHAVIHFGMFEGAASYSKKKIFSIGFAASRKPEIRADTIEKILGDSGKVRINNVRDEVRMPFYPDDIIEKAKNMHQDETPMEYDLFENNCEHFVNLCRYGESHSEQVDPGEEPRVSSKICSIM